MVKHEVVDRDTAEKVLEDLGDSRDQTVQVTHLEREMVKHEVVDRDNAEKVLEDLHIIMVKDYSQNKCSYLGDSRDQTVALLYPPGLSLTQHGSKTGFSQLRFDEIHLCQAQTKYYGVLRCGEERDAVAVENVAINTRVE